MSKKKKKEMPLFKKRYLNEIRAKLVKEQGGDISDEDWDKVVKGEEDKLRRKLEKELPGALWYPIFEMAEKGDVIIEIDGKDIGKEIREKRQKMLEEKKKEGT